MCFSSTGYTGRNCDTFISPCDSSPCFNGASCDAINATAYTCTCLGMY